MSYVFRTKFPEYLAQSGMNKEQFIKKTRLSYRTVYNLYSGSIQRIDAGVWAKLKGEFGLEKLEDMFTLEEVEDD